MNFLFDLFTTSGLLGAVLIIAMFLIPTAIISIFVSEVLVRPRLNKDYSHYIGLVVLGLLIVLVAILSPYSPGKPDQTGVCEKDFSGELVCSDLSGDIFNP